MNSYKPQNPIRIVTAASLFDGHDASINIMRRILQDFGAEVIHLGHNRSVYDIVLTALQESAQAICISSYQGGHMEFFKYAYDLLKVHGADYVKLYGGGGGVIIHEEKRELEDYGISQIFHPDDGAKLGLEGMIEMVVRGADYNVLQAAKKQAPDRQHKYYDPWLDQSRKIGLALTATELGESLDEKVEAIAKVGHKVPVLGITGTGGAGKSSLIDELLHRNKNAFPEDAVAVVCVDPSKRKSGGGLLGDRIRMNSLSRKGIFMRSMASRGSGNEMAAALPDVIGQLKNMGFSYLIAETSGIGQAASNITSVSDISMYVMTSDFGAQSQLEKIDMIDYADLLVINKSDRRGSLDALHDVRKQYKRSHKAFQAKDEDLPVYLCQASKFNDAGVNRLFLGMNQKLKEFAGGHFEVPQSFVDNMVDHAQQIIIPSDRAHYLMEISQTVSKYKQITDKKSIAFSKLGAANNLESEGLDLTDVKKKYASEITSEDQNLLDTYEEIQKIYSQDKFSYQVRDKTIEQDLVTESLSGNKIKKVAIPKLSDWGDRFRYLRLENVPGRFPFTAGVFPLKRAGEDPKRQFAGEGSPEKTNRRFHYLSKNDEAKRLSTAFDSVTLYGEDPDERPDIYGKVGESGVSICSLNDMKKLYAGFDLTSPTTSVSMTINGPAPMILAYFFNTAMDQVIEKKQKELGRDLTEEEVQEARAYALQNVRGTVQADILKEDQAQNTCIFSLDFALKMMGDIQEFFVANKVRNFYSVSISGYHIAEAGANPITQLAFTLANGFTYVEYYLSRGLNIDQIAPNLSFFFSNGLDPEYSVIGRVARRIWAIAMRDLYGAGERSQKLKYHIQTSGRSLHAQEIDFNDIRTTLQALLALNDNCNSLHTNAYDEAITTPTEESVRRAMAIQMIISKEFGLSKCENNLQGSYIVEELTDLVEEAVLKEFGRLHERGGVLGAMETQYQRSKIQDESMYYEHLKHSGELPIIGVNTYQNPQTMEEGYQPPQIELARAAPEEKQQQLNNRITYQQEHAKQAEKDLEYLKAVALRGENIFAALIQVSRSLTLGQMSNALYEVGGQYRRNV
mgnify:CR=1 FL=1